MLQSYPPRKKANLAKLKYPYIHLPMQSLVDFQQFFNALTIEERVEDLLREVNNCHSKLKTLIDSYKVLPRTHTRSIRTEADLCLQVLPPCNNVQKEELIALKNQIDEHDDIILLTELYQQFLSTMLDIRDKKEPESSLRLQHNDLVKRNEQIAFLVNDQTKELCSRIMSEAEGLRALKKDLRDKLENLKVITREEMTSLIVAKFQELRLTKLREFAVQMGTEHQRLLDEKLHELRQCAAILKKSEERTRYFSNELQKHLGEQRHSLSERNYQLLKMTNKLKQLQIEVNECEESTNRQTKKLHDINSITKATVEELNKLMSGLVVKNAHIKAQLCKLVKRATSNNIVFEERFTNRPYLHNAY